MIKSIELKPATCRVVDRRRIVAERSARNEPRNPQSARDLSKTPRTPFGLSEEGHWRETRIRERRLLGHSKELTVEKRGEGAVESGVEGDARLPSSARVA